MRPSEQLRPESSIEAWCDLSGSYISLLLTIRSMQMPQPLLMQTSPAEQTLSSSLPDVGPIPTRVQTHTKPSPMPAQNRMTSCIAKSPELIQTVVLRVIFPIETRSFHVLQSNCRLDSSRVENVLDPRVETNAPLGESHSTANPHSNRFLNLLDPRVDQHAVGAKPNK